MPVAPVVVYRSSLSQDCDERALVMTALGIASTVAHDGLSYALVVDAEYAARAELELARYAHESRAPAPARRVHLHDGAWLAAAAFVGAAFVFSAAAANAAFGIDWLSAGILDATRFRAGEAWRAATALTLHADLAHFFANAGFGALFAWFAARLHGAGRASLAVLLAAIAANAVEAAWLADGRASLGASTAVFAQLGLIAAYPWPELARRARLGRRAASFVAALVLLALLGTGDARTDVAAHALGFSCGWIVGLALRRVRRGTPGADRIAGIVAAVTLCGAWTAAVLTRIH